MEKLVGMDRRNNSKSIFIQMVGTERGQRVTQS